MARSLGASGGEDVVPSWGTRRRDSRAWRGGMMSNVWGGGRLGVVDEVMEGIVGVSDALNL